MTDEAKAAAASRSGSGVTRTHRAVGSFTPGSYSTFPAHTMCSCGAKVPPDAWDEHLKLNAALTPEEPAQPKDAPIPGYVLTGCVLLEDQIAALWTQFLEVATAWDRPFTPYDFARAVERATLAARSPRPAVVPPTPLEELAPEKAAARAALLSCVYFIGHLGARIGVPPLKEGGDIGDIRRMTDQITERWVLLEARLSAANIPVEAATPPSDTGAV